MKNLPNLIVAFSSLLGADTIEIFIFIAIHAFADPEIFLLYFTLLLVAKCTSLITVLIVIIELVFI